MKKLLSGLLLVVSMQAHELYTVEDFIEGITSDDTSLNSSAYGYMLGVIGMMTDKGITGRCVSLPKGADLTSTTEIVFEHIKKHAERPDIPAWALIETALGEAHGFHKPNEDRWCW